MRATRRRHNDFRARGLAHENHVFTNLDDAIAHAHLHVRRRAHDDADEPPPMRAAG